MTQEKKEKILALIAKLKALATNNPSQEEAALAGARMQQLIDRYKIAQAELLDVDSDGEPETDQHEFYSEEGKRFARWRLNLAFELARANNCKGVSQAGSYRWDAMTGTRILYPAKMFIIGTEENVAACRYVFQYLCREIERLSGIALREYNRTAYRKGGKAFGNAFRAGAVDSIIRRLREQKKRSRQEAGTALVLFDREAQAAQDWVRDNMKTYKVNTSMRATDADGYRAGRDAGKRLNLGGSDNGSIGPGRKSLPR